MLSLLSARVAKGREGFVTDGVKSFEILHANIKVPSGHLVERLVVSGINRGLEASNEARASSLLMFDMRCTSVALTMSADFCGRIRRLEERN